MNLKEVEKFLASLRPLHDEHHGCGWSVGILNDPGSIPLTVISPGQHHDPDVDGMSVLQGRESWDGREGDFDAFWIRISARIWRSLRSLSGRNCLCYYREQVFKKISSHLKNVKWGKPEPVRPLSISLTIFLSLTFPFALLLFLSLSFFHLLYLSHSLFFYFYISFFHFIVLIEFLLC